jgi:hypothetical protein
MSKKAPAPKKLKKAATSEEQKKQEVEIKRQRELIKDTLYPFLLKNTKSIAEAKRICYEVTTAMTQEFQKRIADAQKDLSGAKTTALPIFDITKKGDEFKVNQALYKLFENETIAVANALIGGMSQALDSFINEEVSKRKLDTLKTDFL